VTKLKKTRDRVGRPAILEDKSIRDEILLRMYEGESLTKILSSDKKKFPTRMNFYKYLIKEENFEFRYSYEQALENKADFWVEQAMELADEANPENVQVKRLQVDVRKWAASKHKPKKYGAQSTMTVSGDAANPVIFEVHKKDAEEMSDDEIEVFLSN